MKFEQTKSSLIIKGTAEVYHSVTYLNGYQRFWAFSLDNAYYDLEEKQDQEGRVKSKLRELTQAEFDALLVRCRQMTAHWKNKKGLKTYREDFRDQVMQFGHDCRKTINLRKNEIEVFTENDFNSALEQTC